jgi:hypothetical protein
VKAEASEGVGVAENAKITPIHKTTAIHRTRNFTITCPRPVANTHRRWFFFASPYWAASTAHLRGSRLRWQIVHALGIQQDFEWNAKLVTDTLAQPMPETTPTVPKQPGILPLEGQVDH